MIPWSSALVQGYVLQTSTPKPINTPKYTKKPDLGLIVLWLHGYEEYTRQRFSEGGSSVLIEWDRMFGKLALPSAVIPPKMPSTSCGTGELVGSIGAQAVGGAGAGAMVGSAVGPVGTAVGAAIGALVGGGIAAAGKSNCFKTKKK